MASPRRPNRLLDKNNISSAYPKELVADFSTGELTLVNESGDEVQTNPLTLQESGNGNGISSVTVNGRTITIQKDTFLKSHPVITTSADTTSSSQPGNGGTFTVVDGVTRDSNGHVTKINTKTITLPNAGLDATLEGLRNDVDSAASAASSAQNAASSAASAASNAQQTANSAASAASSAQSTANTANSNASTALSTANSKATTILYSASIGTAWSGSAAPYTQAITVNGILASDTPIVDVNLASIAYANKDNVIEAYSKIYRIVTAANKITVYADEKTTVAVPIQLKVVR